MSELYFTRENSSRPFSVFNEPDVVLLSTVVVFRGTAWMILFARYGCGERSFGHLSAKGTLVTERHGTDLLR